MCKVHRNLYNKSSKFPSEIVPKSILNRARKPSKTTLRKSVPQKHRQIKKVPQMASHRGVPGWTSNVIFRYFGAPGPLWGPPWLPDLAPGPSGPLRTLIFGDFRSLLGRFWEDFGWICVTMSCRIVTRVLAISQDFLGPLLAATHPHNPQPTVLDPLLGTVAGMARRAFG